MVRPTGPTHGPTEARVLDIFHDTLELDVDGETPLIEEGLLDSVGFVTLLSQLEQAFGVSVDIASLDLDDFTNVVRIARLVDSLCEAEG